MPTKPLVDDQFIVMVTDMGVKFSQYQVNQAIDLVRNADEIFAKTQSSGEILNPIYKDLDPEDKVLFLAVPLSTPALDAAMEMMYTAKKVHQQAKNFAELNVALKEILTSPAVGNEDRLSSALSTLLKSVTLPTLALILAQPLAVDNSLPVQSILGTFVKVHGWDELQRRLQDAVTKHMSYMHDIYSDKATAPEHEEDLNRAAQASIQLVIKLAIAHLTPYINESHFDKSDNPELITLADRVDGNKTH